MAGFAAENARVREMTPEGQRDRKQGPATLHIPQDSFRTDFGAAGEAHAETVGAVSFLSGKAAETLTDAPIQASKNHPENEVQFDVPQKEKTARYGNDVGKYYSEHSANNLRDSPKGRAGVYEDFVRGLKDAVGEEAFNALGEEGIKSKFSTFASTTSHISGLVPSRLHPNFTDNGLGSEMSDDDISGMMSNLMAPALYKGMNPEELSTVSQDKLQKANDRFDVGVLQLKQAFYTQLKRMRDRYGVYGSQMHPEDFIKRAGPQFFDDATILQDCLQLVEESGSKYFNFEENEEDRDFRNLTNYFQQVSAQCLVYFGGLKNGDAKMFLNPLENYDPELEKAVGGKDFTEKQQRRYNRSLKKRFKKEGKSNRLFDRFEEDLTVLDKVKPRLPKARLNYEDYGGDPSKYYNDNKKKLPGYRDTQTKYAADLKKDIWQEIQPQLTDADKNGGLNGRWGNLRSASGKTMINGLDYGRMMTNFSEHGFGSEKTGKEIGGVFAKLLAGRKYQEMSPEEKAKQNPQEVEKMDATFDEGMYELKEMYYRQLIRLRDRYGRYGTQMHPEDFVEKAGPQFFDDIAIAQDASQLLDDGGDKYFDFDNNPKDAEFKNLADYYMEVSKLVHPYMSAMKNLHDSVQEGDQWSINDAYSSFQGLNTNFTEVESRVGGMGFTEKEQQQYFKELKERFKKKGWERRLFGKFKG